MPKKDKFMDPNEVKKRIQAGVKARIADGRMADPNKLGARPDPNGAHFTKPQRKRFQELTNIAIYELANYRPADWYDAITELISLMKAANFTAPVVAHTMKNIEHVAVECAQDKGLYAVAAKYLYDSRNRVISIPGQAPKHATREAANDPSKDSVHRFTQREGVERESSDGEARGPKGRIH